MRAFLVAIVILFSTPVLGVAVDEKPLEDPAKEAIARALMKEIRCLVCQNQSIEDSNADLAKDLRALVRERVALGDAPENVRAYLVDRYGDWVLLEPPVNQMTLLLWASPFLFLVLVAAAVFSSRKKTAAEPLSADEKEKLAKLMAEGNDT